MLRKKKEDRKEYKVSEISYLLECLQHYITIGRLHGIKIARTYIVSCPP